MAALLTFVVNKFPMCGTYKSLRRGGLHCTWRTKVIDHIHLRSWFYKYVFLN